MAEPIDQDQGKVTGHRQERRLKDLVGSGPRKARFLFEQVSFDLLCFEDEGHKGSFAPAPFIRGQASKTVATVNQLLDGKFQDPILQIL